MRLIGVIVRLLNESAWLVSPVITPTNNERLKEKKNIYISSVFSPRGRRAAEWSGVGLKILFERIDPPINNRNRSKSFRRRSDSI